MAQIKLYKGTRNEINDKAIENGALYIATDAQELYFDDGVRINLSLKGLTYWNDIQEKPIEISETQPDPSIVKIWIKA